MRHLLITLAAALFAFGCACEQRGGTSAPAAGGVGAGTERSGGSAAPAQGRAQAPATAARAAPAPATEVDWATVAPAPERQARNALFGIVRQMDLSGVEDSGAEVLSFNPETGPEDSAGYGHSPVTVLGDTFDVTEAHWLALFDLVERWQVSNPEGFKVRPMPDARYGDGETSERGDLLFEVMVEDRQEKTLKFMWERR